MDINAAIQGAGMNLVGNGAQYSCDVMIRIELITLSEVEWQDEARASLGQGSIIVKILVGRDLKGIFPPAGSKIGLDNDYLV